MAQSGEKKFGLGSVFAAGLGGLVVGNVTAGEPREPVEASTLSLFEDAGPARSTHYRNCFAARAAGAAPVYRGQPGYGGHLDRDNDGVGCE